MFHLWRKALLDYRHADVAHGNDQDVLVARKCTGVQDPSSRQWRRGEEAQYAGRWIECLGRGETGYSVDRPAGQQDPAVCELRGDMLSGLKSTALKTLPHTLIPPQSANQAAW